MALNYIWVSFFLIAILTALGKLVLGGDAETMNALMTALFDSAKTAFEICLGLTGVLCFWLGLMRVGEAAGMVGFLARVVGPFFRRLFPEVPKDHPVFGAILMNFSANMLGLDNAATPLGLKAMQGLQDLNPDKDRATNAQIMFLVLNTAGLTIIPISILMYRAQVGAQNPADVFIPLLIALYSSTLTGVVVTALIQRIRLTDPVLASGLLGTTALVFGGAYGLSLLPPDQLEYYSKLASSLVLMLFVLAFIVAGVVRRINVYEAFVDGAKGGFQVAVGIVPYLVAMLVGIALLRASGALTAITDGIGWVVGALGADTAAIPALPTALMKSLSGSGARGLFIETMQTYGPDSFQGRMASIFQGCSDTTFYILAVYFGSVGIKRMRYAMGVGLLADVAGIIGALVAGYIFFG